MEGMQIGRIIVGDTEGTYEAAKKLLKNGKKDNPIREQNMLYGYPECQLYALNSGVQEEKQLNNSSPVNVELQWCFREPLSKRIILCNRINYTKTLFLLLCTAIGFSCLLILCVFAGRIITFKLSQTGSAGSINYLGVMTEQNKTDYSKLSTKAGYKQTKSWESLYKDAVDKKRLHFQVGQTKRNEKLYSSEEQDGTYHIHGRPPFCKGFTPVNMTFLKSDYLCLENMAECDYYTKLVLGKWHFPQVRHIKLQWMVLEKPEFEALISFIDRHNETISFLEIDNSYLCPSPDCDAGLINYPTHDFKIKITRRQSSSGFRKNLADY